MYKKIILFLVNVSGAHSIDIDKNLPKVHIYYTEEELHVIKKQHIKWKLLKSQIQSFTPIFLFGNLISKQEFIFIFSALQVIIGPNNTNIASVTMNLIILNYGDKNSKYIFTTYSLYTYLFLLHKYLSFQDVKTTSLELTGAFFTLLTFGNYFTDEKNNIFIPILFFIYSIFLMPATIEANNKKIDEQLLTKDYSMYTTL